MDNLATYQAKLTTPENAVSSIRSGSIISMGMAMSEPPALLRALAERVEASELSDIRLPVRHEEVAAFVSQRQTFFVRESYTKPNQIASETQVKPFAF